MKQRTCAKWIPWAAAGLAFLGTVSWTSVTQGQVTNVVSNTTFEDATYDLEGNPTAPDGYARWPWAYRYAWGTYSDPGVDPVADLGFKYPADTPTNTCHKVVFDTTTYTEPQSGGGYGMGFGAGMNWNSFNPETVKMSTNRADYILSFDARAEGLLPDVATISGQMQVQMDAPDDSIQPPDADGGGDRIIQINQDVAVGSNWTHFEYTLDTANVDGGTPEKNLTLYGQLINSVNYNFNFDSPGRAFGFDADNVVYLDNVKLRVIMVTNTPSIPPPTTSIAIADWNFDDKPLDNVYGGYAWSANSSNPTFTYSGSAAGYGMGGSNAWILQMDNSVFASDPPAWAGGGTGGSGPVRFSEFSTSDLSAYAVSFEARVEGLTPDKLTTVATLQLFFDAPDDTLLPADDNTDNDSLARLDFSLAGVETNWQTFTFTLNSASVGGGSKTNLQAFYSKINGFRTQWQIENAASAGDWSYDADNSLIIDNFKLARTQVGCPPVILTTVGNTLKLTWDNPSSGTVKLQSATSLAGPWNEVAGASSGYTTPAVGTQSFFRTVWVPPTQ